MIDTSDILRVACKPTLRGVWRPVITITPDRISEAREFITMAYKLDPIAQWRIETRGGRPVK